MIDTRAETERLDATPAEVKVVSIHWNERSVQQPPARETALLGSGQAIDAAVNSTIASENNAGRRVHVQVIRLDSKPLPARQMFSSFRDVAWHSTT